jgi:hypothetical protein
VQAPFGKFDYRLVVSVRFAFFSHALIIERAVISASSRDPKKSSPSATHCLEHQWRRAIAVAQFAQVGQLFP